MSLLTPLQLTNKQYGEMVQLGAFDHLNKKIELIYGQIVEMNPAGPYHNSHILYLTRWSHQVIDPVKTIVAVQIGIDLIGLESQPEPDLMWLKNGSYRKNHPRAEDVQLAVEVSDSSLERDLEIKRILYASAKIPEFWVVDCHSQSIHVFRDPQSNDYKTVSILRQPSLLSPLVQPHAILDLEDMFQDS